jgi:hypothetical protein
VICEQFAFRYENRTISDDERAHSWWLAPKAAPHLQAASVSKRGLRGRHGVESGGRISGPFQDDVEAEGGEEAVIGSLVVGVLVTAALLNRSSNLPS